MTWRDEAAGRNEATRRAGRWRAVRDFDSHGVTGRLGDGREVVSFASNDYLGLSQHPSVIKGATDAADRWGAGTGSARLIVGARPIHSELEEELAAWKGKERALLFPNGAAANIGVLSAFGTEGTVIFSDELNHASIVDGCRMAKADVKVYPHRDVDVLEQMLRTTPARPIIVSDSVFSMDGDLAPLEDLTEVAGRHDALLILDEAHAVLGPHPAPTDKTERLRVGTLSKFLGAMGGFVAADAPFIDLLTNEARSFIFTTAASPADAGAALAALRVLRSAEGAVLTNRLLALIDRVAPGHRSPIIPFVVGDEAAAMAASALFLERGLLVPAIRPPSVPAGSSRLRVTLSAAHTDEQLERLIGALDEVAAVPIVA